MQILILHSFDMQGANRHSAKIDGVVRFQDRGQLGDFVSIETIATA